MRVKCFISSRCSPSSALVTPKQSSLQTCLLGESGGKEKALLCPSLCVPRSRIRFGTREMRRLNQIPHFFNLKRFKLVFDLAHVKFDDYINQALLAYSFTYPSFIPSSQDATIHGSEENLSVYELVERENTSAVNENLPSGKSCFQILFPTKNSNSLTLSVPSNQ